MTDLPKVHGVFDSSRNIHCLVGKDQRTGLSGQEIDEAARRCNAYPNMREALEVIKKTRDAYIEDGKDFDEKKLVELLEQALEDKH